MIIIIIIASNNNNNNNNKYVEWIEKRINLPNFTKILINFDKFLELSS